MSGTRTRLAVVLTIASFATVVLTMVTSVLLDGTAGIDFGVFTVGGELAGRGEWDTLYDGPRFSALVHEQLFPSLAGDGTLNTFISTPPFAVAVWPLSLLPFGLSVVVWTVATGVVVVAATCALGLSNRWAVGLLCSPALVVDLAIGQSALIFIGLTVIVHRSICGGRNVRAGLVLGVMFALKPPLAVGYCLWWLVTLRRSWPQIVGAAGGLALALVPTLLIGSGSWSAFVNAMRERVAIESSWQLNGVSLPEAMKLVAPLAPTWFTLLSWALSLVVGGALLVAANRRWGNDVELLSASAVAVTVLVSPHLAVYDSALLIVPLAVLWKRRLSTERLAILLAIHGMTLAFGNLLYDLQYDLVGRGISIEFVGYVISLVLACRWLRPGASIVPNEGDTLRTSARVSLERYAA